jgi:hypothetical protein
MGIRKIINSINAELYRASKASRRGVLQIGFITVLFLAGKSLTEAHISLPFLRGGYVALSLYSPPVYEHKQRKRKNAANPVMHRLSDLHNSLNLMGNKIQSETQKHWTGIQSHIEREWSKLASGIFKLFPVKQKVNLQRLDDVLASFKSVLRNGKEVEIAQLLKACRAHLILVKSGGTALKLVAKDMESNLQKAETLHRLLQSQNKGKDLSSMLEIEREQGIHDGNVLHDPSAAMGLLWIRRSLAFQMDLYSSLLPSSTQSPAQAAMDAYNKHLLPFHGWMLQKVFPLSLSQMPERQVFIAKFGGMESKDLNDTNEREIVEKLGDLVKTWEPLIGAWKEEFAKMDMEDVRRA